jgi:hypothetical protein
VGFYWDLELGIWSFPAALGLVLGAFPYAFHMFKVQIHGSLRAERRAAAAFAVSAAA